MDKRSFIYGRMPVLELLRDGEGFEHVLVQKGIEKDVISEIKILGSQTRTPVQVVPKARLDRVTRKNHQGVVGFKRWVEYRDLTTVVQSCYEGARVPLVLVLDRITDVRNVGAIARSAEVFGATALVLPSRESAMLNEDAVKTSAGAILNIDICRESVLTTACRSLREMGLKLYVADANAEVIPADVDMSVPMAIVLGSERKGVHPSIVSLCDGTFAIPQFGQTDSLNVSVAAGILLYEAVRQRKHS